MAFLDNSGDIILDAVLTDTGRYRLAKGDGSFKIVKFALGDEEINYGLYNKTHPSGSAYYDLQILQTPILEAFTNNTSTMKTKLISIPRTNLKYLPVLKAFDSGDSRKYNGGSFTGPWVVAVDLATAGNSSQDDALIKPSGDVAEVNGILNGFNPNGGNAYIRVDQGLDTTAIPFTYTIDADLNETQYIVEIDNRLGAIVSTGGQATNVSFIDDDNIASYFFSLTEKNIVSDLGPDVPSDIAGPRGTFIQFKIRASTELTTSTYLFEQLGSSGLTIKGNGTEMTNARYIDSTIKITGATTGYSVDIPVRFVKAT